MKTAPEKLGAEMWGASPSVCRSAKRGCPVQRESAVSWMKVGALGFAVRF